MAVIALAFTACSSGDGGKTTSTTKDTSTSSSGADPNGIIKEGYDLVQEGGTAVFGDPAKAENNATANDALYYLVYGRFMTQNDDGSLTPDLAKSATIIDDKTVEIVLRDGLEFSDGTPLDAAAVKAGLERSLAAHLDAAFLPPFFSLKSVEIVNPTTVRLSIPDGTAAGWYDTYIAQWQVSIAKPGETNFDAPAGAGPMTVVSYDRGQRLVLKKNPKYWNAKNVKVAGYEFTQVAGAQAQSGTAALRAGQVDLVTTEPSQLPALTGKLTTYAKISADQAVSLQVCKREGPMANAKARLALNKAIDRKAINQAIFKGTGEPATEIWPDGHRFNDPKLKDYLAYDPEGAKKLMKEAGYPNGFSIDMYIVAFAGLPETAEAIKQQAAAVGITVNLKSGGNYVNDYLTPKRPGVGIIPGGSVGLQKLNFWVGDSLGNQCNYNDPKLTAIQQQLAALSQSDPKAVELWHQAEEIVVHQALGVFIVFRSALAAYNTDRLSMKPLALGQFITPDPLKSYIKAK